MNKAHEKYNAMPFEYRETASNSHIFDQLNYLNIEKQRAVRFHKKHLAAINLHIKNIEKEINKKGLS